MATELETPKYHISRLKKYHFPQQEPSSYWGTPMATELETPKGFAHPKVSLSEWFQQRGGT